MPAVEIQNRQIAIWLVICAASIFIMILLGGVTRLTHSGLSMVEWKPLLGTIPPLTETDWLLTFEKYKAFPEYQKINAGMTLSEFKFIFYFEYFHRLLGRLIGVIFFIPFIYFWLRGYITRSLLPKLSMIFLLGGLQGLLGWYMVKSGLIDVPRVSSYRLTAHLGMAVLIYAYILWVVFGLANKPQAAGTSKPVNSLYRYSATVTVIIFIMILSGGLVAGTRAGFAYNTFPLMAGQLVPEGLFFISPFWRNFFENIVTVQFNHRILAYLIFILVSLLCLWVIRSKKGFHLKVTACVLLALLLIQIGLGISTLINLVPLSLALMHQAGAILLFTTVLYLTYQLKYDAIVSSDR